MLGKTKVGDKCPPRLEVQASRCAGEAAFFYLGKLIEYGETIRMFTTPKGKQADTYISGGFG